MSLTPSSSPMLVEPYTDSRADRIRPTHRPCASDAPFVSRFPARTDPPISGRPQIFVSSHAPPRPYINPSSRFPGFLRTYSARIYSIETNSSLACLHMPHPSNPVDDTSARSFNREHIALRGVEDVRLGGASLPSGERATLPASRASV